MADGEPIDSVDLLATAIQARAHAEERGTPGLEDAVPAPFCLKKIHDPAKGRGEMIKEIRDARGCQSTEGCHDPSRLAARRQERRVRQATGQAPGGGGNRRNRQP